jgi:hypothetical protein
MDKATTVETCQSIYVNLIELCKNRTPDMKATGYVREWLQTIRCDKYDKKNLVKDRRLAYEMYLKDGAYERICNGTATTRDEENAVNAVAHYKIHDIAILKSVLNSSNHVYHEVVDNGDRTLVLVGMLGIVIGAVTKLPIRWPRYAKLSTRRHSGNRRYR